MSSEVSPSPMPVTAQATASATAPLQIPVRMRQAINGVVLVLLLLNVVVLMSPGVWKQVVAPPIPETSTSTLATTKTVADRNHAFELVVPSSWIAEDNENFSLFVGSRSEDVVVCVFAESKDQLKQLGAKYQQLDSYSEVVRSKLVDHLSGGTQTSPTPLIINGLPAIQSQIEGGETSGKVTFLHTVVETPTDFYTIRAVISSSRYPVAKPQLEAVAASFRMRDGTSAYDH